jgi:hypothetical protein
MTLSIITSNITLSIVNVECHVFDIVILSVVIECCNAECHYAECRSAL